MRDSWDECSVYTHAMILAYDQLREHDEDDVLSQMAKASIAPFRR